MKPSILFSVVFTSRASAVFRQALSFTSPEAICAERHKAARPPHTRQKTINSGWLGMKHTLFKETPLWCFSPTKSEQELQQLISKRSCLSLLPNICARVYTSLPSLALLPDAARQCRGQRVKGKGGLLSPVPCLSEKNPWDIWSCIKSPPERSLVRR